MKVAMFQLFQPLKRRKFHTICGCNCVSQPRFFFLRGSGQVSQNWSPDSFSSDHDVIASKQPHQAANKPVERRELFGS